MGPPEAAPEAPATVANGDGAHAPLRAAVAELLHKGQLKEAQQKVDKERRKCHRHGDFDGELVACQLSAELLLRAGKAEDALKVARKARDMCRRAANLRGEVNALLAIAWSLHMKSEGAEAKEAAEEARSICREAKDVEGETMALHALKDLCLSDTKERRGGEALDAISAALAISKNGDHPELEALSLHAAGSVHARENESQQALQAVSEARALYKKAGSISGELAALDTLAALHFSSGEAQKAREEVQETRNMCAQAGDLRTKAVALHGAFAHLAVIDKDLDAAGGAFQEARAAARELQDPRLEAALLQSRATAHELIDQREEGRRLAGEAREVTKGSGDTVAEVSALLHVAHLRGPEDFQGKTPPEVKEARQLLHDAGDLQGESSMLCSYASMSLQHGAVKEAVRAFQEAAAAADCAGRGEHSRTGAEADGAARALEVGARALLEAGCFQEAVELARQAAKRWRVAGCPVEQGAMLNVVACIHLQAVNTEEGREALQYSAASPAGRAARGHRAGALKASEEAVKVLRGRIEALPYVTEQEKSVLGSALHNMANAKILFRDVAGAGPAAEEALALFREVGSEACQAAALLTLSQANQLGGRTRGAARTAKQAQALFQKAGTSAGSFAAAEVLNTSWQRSGMRGRIASSTG